MRIFSISRVLYEGIDCAWRREEAAAGLEAAARHLALAHCFAEPVRGSVHSFGMAVDVTPVDAHGREAGMGSAFDEMSPRSHPALLAEAMLLAGSAHWPRFDGAGLFFETVNACIHRVDRLLATSAR